MPALLHEPDHQPEPRVSYVVARLERALRAEINERVKPHGLLDDAPVHDAEHPRARRRALQCATRAGGAYMTPQSMSEVLDALEEEGVVERTPHPNHRRVFPAALTAKGRKVLRSCNAAVDEPGASNT